MWCIFYLTKEVILTQLSSILGMNISSVLGKFSVSLYMQNLNLNSLVQNMYVQA